MGSPVAPLRTLENALWLSPVERDAILRFEAGLAALLGAHLEGVILFGSRARGEGSQESDLDLAVVLSGDEGPHWRRIVDLATELNLEFEYWVRISPLVLSRAKLQGLWERERAIASAILGEGIVV